MRATPLMKLTRRQLPAALAATALLPACSDGIDVAEWTEEVKLHDGQMVTVWRRERRGSSGFPTAHRGALIDTEVKYAPLGAHWKSTIYRDPCSFELFDGVPHLTLWLRDRESCRDKARTDYMTQFLRWSGQAWEDVPQKSFPVDRALMNLTDGFWGRTKEEDYRGQISWDTKRLYGNRNPTDTVKTHFEHYKQFCARLQDS